MTDPAAKTHPETEAPAVPPEMEAPPPAEAERALTPDERNLVDWAGRLNLDQEKVLSAFRDMEETAETVEVMTIGDINDLVTKLGKDKVEQLRKRRHHCFFLFGYDPQGIFRAGSFVVQYPTRGERIDVLRLAAQYRGGLDEISAGLLLSNQAEDQAREQVLLKAWPHWYEVGPESEDLFWFEKVADEVRRFFDGF